MLPGMYGYVSAIESADIIVPSKSLNLYIKLTNATLVGFLIVFIYNFNTVDDISGLSIVMIFDAMALQL
jgi:hypothetical protein